MGHLPRGRSQKAVTKPALRAACGKYAKLTDTQQSVLIRVNSWLILPLTFCPKSGIIPPSLAAFRTEAALADPGLNAPQQTEHSESHPSNAKSCIKRVRFLSRILYKFALFVQNKPNFENRPNSLKRSFHNGLRKHKALAHSKNEPKTNPNEPKHYPSSFRP